ncbi:MAG: SIS domain-containing protein [Acidobacteria bacterium]|nr:SIS domain-containing protein [Acidobacteriota bacterium]
MPVKAPPAPPDIQSRLAEAYRDLPEAQRAVADALMGDPLLGALWGIEAMAQRARVSPGTVMRLARRLGFGGFSDFRDALRAACRTRSGEKGLEDLEGPADLFGTLAEVVQRDSQHLARMIQAVDHDTLEAAGRALLGARHRVILGRGIGQVMGLILAFYLTQAGVPCVAALPSDFSNQAANLGREDLLVAISFHPYSRETLDAAAFARQNGVPVLALSDRADSPLAGLSDLLIPVPSEDLLFSCSLTSFAALAHAFAIVLAARDPAGTLKRLKAADRVAQPLFVEHWLPAPPVAIRKRAKDE